MKTALLLAAALFMMALSGCCTAMSLDTKARDAEVLYVFQFNKKGHYGVGKTFRVSSVLSDKNTVRSQVFTDLGDPFQY